MLARTQMGQAPAPGFPVRSHNPCPRQQLLEMFRNLTRDEQIHFVALALMGRGAYQPNQWNRAVAEATTAHDNDRMADCVVGFQCWMISRELCGVDGKPKYGRCVMT